MVRRCLRMVPLALLAAAASVTVPGGPALAAPSMSGMDGAAAAPAGSADAQMRAGMQQMQMQMKDASVSGDPDHDFVAMMLPHHEGAVSMAEVELQHGKDPTLLRLAHAIIASQDKEIVFMKTWLARHPVKTASTR